MRHVVLASRSSSYQLPTRLKLGTAYGGMVGKIQHHRLVSLTLPSQLSRYVPAAYKSVPRAS
jgi:hypothetical protein